MATDKPKRGWRAQRFCYGKNLVAARAERAEKQQFQDNVERERMLIVAREMVEEGVLAPLEET